VAARVVVLTCVLLFRLEFTDLSWGLLALLIFVFVDTTVWFVLLLPSVADKVAEVLLDDAPTLDPDLVPEEPVYLLDNVLYEVLLLTGVV
jgi:hypothetical protein